MPKLKKTKMFKFFSSKAPEADAYKNVMGRAKELHGLENKQGLFDLIKIIMLPLKAKHISDAYFKRAGEDMRMIRFPQDFGFTSLPDTNGSFSNGYEVLRDCIVDILRFGKKINLASDTILPTCWDSSSMVNVLGKIGADSRYSNGAFKQSINHKVVYTYPLDISWVNGGNHSITQGILRGEGTLKPQEIIDLTPLMKLVRFDGIGWRGIKCNEKLGIPRYIEFGMAWEIGRLITELQPSPYV